MTFSGMKVSTCAAALVVLTSCNGKTAPPAAPTPDTFNVTGEMTLTDGSGFDPSYSGHKGDDCYGMGGYGDINQGAQVVVSNSKGEQIALGELDGGVLTPLPGTQGMGLFYCTFTFTITDVPADGEIFSVEVTHRGSVNFHKGEPVALSLG